jgi:opacity protein-like surface antigen
MKNYRLLLIVLFISAGMMAQYRESVVLDVHGSYTFSNSVDFDYGDLKIGDGHIYGTGLEFFSQKSSSIKLKYLRFDTLIDVDVPISANDVNVDGAFKYILIGGNHYFDFGSNAVPYLGGGLGMAITEIPYGGSDTNFAWEIKGGVKIKTASIVSISHQANLMSTIAIAGTDLIGDIGDQLLYRIMLILINLA